MDSYSKSAWNLRSDSDFPWEVSERNWNRIISIYTSHIHLVFTTLVHAGWMLLSLETRKETMIKSLIDIKSCERILFLLILFNSFWFYLIKIKIMLYVLLLLTNFVNFVAFLNNIICLLLLTNFVALVIFVAKIFSFPNKYEIWIFKLILIPTNYTNN